MIRGYTEVVKLTPRLAAVFGLFFSTVPSGAIFCRAAEVVIEIRVPADIKNKSSLLNNSDNLVARRVENLSATRAGGVLSYKGTGWATGVTSGDQKEMLSQLHVLWGKDNVNVKNASAAPEKPRGKKPSPRKMKIVQNQNKKTFQAAAVDPGKFYDGGGFGGAQAVVVDGRLASRVRTRADSSSKKSIPVAGFRSKSVPALAQDGPKRGSLPKQKIAAIIYNETAELRPLLKDPRAPAVESNYDPASAKGLHEARKMIAMIANKRKGRGVAAPVVLGKNDLKNPVVAMVWKNSMAAASAPMEGKDSIDGKICNHFVMWPADDSPLSLRKRPAYDPRIGADWPYTGADKIKKVFGPFRNPTGSGDVPTGSNIYLFVYCGLK